MTLPFRRRHHDDEAPHDRARALISAGFLGPVSEADEGWLEGHLERCPECRADRAGYLADRSLLQSLRQSPPSPPRDLWARTAAAIERESSHSRRSLLGRAIGPKPRGIPLGPLAGVVVAAVVLVVALLPPGTTIAPSRTATPPVVAQATPGRTPLTVDNQVAWLQHEPDGSYSIVFGEVDQVCADPDTSACVIAPGSPAPIAIAAQPQSVVLSPDSNQVAVVPADDQPDGDLVIVSVPTPAPSEPAPSFGTRSAPPTSRPSAPPATAPIESPGASPLPSASAGPIPNGHAIIHGVAIVGEPAYSADGQWFAFSARPKVGLRGPDLYVWHVGDDAATQLTDDGLTYFAGWYRNQIVASTVTLGSSTTTLDGGQAGAGSASPTAPAPASPVPASAPASPGAADSPLASDSPSEPAGVELHPTSFLLDPTTRTRTDFARPDVWLPSIDPTGHFVVYWSGTVAADPMTSAAPAGSSPSGVPVFVFGGVRSLRPATGSLVLDGWTAPLVLPSASPAASGAAQSAPPPTPTEAPTQGPLESGSGLPSAGPSGAPAVADGPAGTILTLADGPLTAFDARFDPTGTRLAVWTADPGDATLGPLRLVLLDPGAGAIDPTVQPLAAPGVIALRGFSMEAGRLGWVTPPGQNGQLSSVQVLAWKDDDFGQVLTVPGGNPQILR